MQEVKIDCVNVRFKVEVAFMNDKNPAFFQRRPVYVCCLTERSDGQMIDFRRTRLVCMESLVHSNTDDLKVRASSRIF